MNNFAHCKGYYSLRCRAVVKSTLTLHMEAWSGQFPFVTCHIYITTRVNCGCMLLFQGDKGFILAPFVTWYVFQSAPQAANMAGFPQWHVLDATLEIITRQSVAVQRDGASRLAKKYQWQKFLCFYSKNSHNSGENGRIWKKYLNLFWRLCKGRFSYNIRPMQGFLHCVRPPGMDFWAIFTHKTVIIWVKMAVLEKNI